MYTPSHGAVGDMHGSGFAKLSDAAINKLHSSETVNIVNDLVCFTNKYLMVAFQSFFWFASFLPMLILEQGEYQYFGLFQLYFFLFQYSYFKITSDDPTSKSGRNKGVYLKERYATSSLPFNDMANNYDWQNYCGKEFNAVNGECTHEGEDALIVCHYSNINKYFFDIKETRLIYTYKHIQAQICPNFGVKNPKKTSKNA